MGGNGLQGRAERGQWNQLNEEPQPKNCTYRVAIVLQHFMNCQNILQDENLTDALPHLSQT